MTKTCTILISGDFCPVHRVGKSLFEDNDQTILNGFNELITNSDLVITNLECPLIDSGTQIKKIGPVLKAPVETAQFLKNAGFHLVTLANNHIMDYGEEGLESTLRACHDAGIGTVGAGPGVDEARIAFKTTIKGRRISILNIAENEFSTITGVGAGANPFDPVNNYYDIIAARNEADFVLVITHGGVENYSLPSPNIKKLYRFFVDAGADAVIGHHTHCVSGYEVYHEAPIFYSLGNFIFDNPLRMTSEWNQGIVVTLSLSDKLDFSIMPFRQCEGETAGIRMLSPDERKSFFQVMQVLNATILDDDALQNNYDQLLEKINHVYLAPFFVGNRFLRKLVNRKLLPLRFFTNERRRIILTNLIRCESHRDIVLRGLEDKLC